MLGQEFLLFVQPCPRSADHLDQCLLDLFGLPEALVTGKGSDQIFILFRVFVDKAPKTLFKRLVEGFVELCSVERIRMRSAISADPDSLPDVRQIRSGR